MNYVVGQVLSFGGPSILVSNQAGNLSIPSTEYKAAFQSDNSISVVSHFISWWSWLAPPGGSVCTSLMPPRLTLHFLQICEDCLFLAPLVGGLTSFSFFWISGWCFPPLRPVHKPSNLLCQDLTLSEFVTHCPLRHLALTFYSIKQRKNLLIDLLALIFFTDIL